jgi:hypothetical protein
VRSPANFFERLVNDGKQQNGSMYCIAPNILSPLCRLATEQFNNHRIAAYFCVPDDAVTKQAALRSRNIERERDAMPDGTRHRRFSINLAKRKWYAHFRAVRFNRRFGIATPACRRNAD